MLNTLCAQRPISNGLAIFGAGASGREIAWLAQQCWGPDLEITFLVDQADLAGSTENGFPVVHVRDFALKSSETPVVVAIGDPPARMQCVDTCVRAGLQFVSLVHPRVEASDWVSVGLGTIICVGSILTTNINVGAHVHINIGCTISHDADIGDFSTLSPGVRIAGWVTMGRRVFLGTGATVMNGTSARPIAIGDDAIIGAGACVIRDVSANATVVGVPANRVL